MIEARATASEDVLNAIDDKLKAFIRLYGKRPLGIVLGAQDYLELCATCHDIGISTSGRFQNPERVTEIFGLPVHVSQITRRMELLIDPRDAILFTRHEVVEESDE